MWNFTGFSPTPNRGLQGFSNGVDWWRGQFGQNGQKLHENYKIGIFGQNWGGGQANFLGSGGEIPPVPPLGETLVSHYDYNLGFPEGG